MNAASRLLSLVAMTSVGTLLLTGCEDGGGDGSSGPANVTGTWDMTAAVQGEQDHVLVLYLTQSGTAVSGPASDVTSSASGSVNGVVSGSSISMTISMPWGEGDCSGMVEGNSMVGTFTSPDGVRGTWSATKR